MKVLQAAWWLVVVAAANLAADGRARGEDVAAAKVEPPAAAADREGCAAASAPATCAHCVAQLTRGDAAAAAGCFRNCTSGTGAAAAGAPCAADESSLSIALSDVGAARWPGRGYTAQARRAHCHERVHETCADEDEGVRIRDRKKEEYLLEFASGSVVLRLAPASLPRPRNTVSLAVANTLSLSCLLAGAAAPADAGARALARAPEPSRNRPRPAPHRRAAWTRARAGGAADRGRGGRLAGGAQNHRVHEDARE